MAASLQRAAQFEDFLSRRRALALTGGLLCAALSGVAYALEAAGEVINIRGEATAEAKGERRPLGIRERVFVDDLVLTGEDARLAMRLGSGATLKLGGSAKLRIDRYMAGTSGEFVLAEGAMLFDRPKSAARMRTIFRSVYGLMAVRGTRFFAGPSNGVFGVFVDRGRVSVSAAGRTVVVAAGFGTNIPRPDDAPSTPSRWGSARVAAALRSVE
jgi:hypothetical protein